MTNNLFNSVCERLEALPYNTVNGLEIQESHREWYFGVDRYDVGKTAENIEKFIRALRMEGYKGNLPRFSKIVDNRMTEYKKIGWKYVEEFLDHQRTEGGKLYSVVIDLNDKPLYSKKTVETALKAIKKVSKGCLAYWKVEGNDKLKNNIHCHILILSPEGFTFPKVVNNYRVLVESLGSKEKYKHKTMYENTRDFMIYLFKPSDGRASFKVKAHVEQMFLEWWEESLVTEEGNPTWERVNLRGALNLKTKWLKDFTRKEIEARYTAETISKLEENNNPINPLPPTISTQIVKLSSNFYDDLTQSNRVLKNFSFSPHESQIPHQRV